MTKDSRLMNRTGAIKGVSAETVAGFLQACHRVAAAGLVRCSSGNLSLRVDAERLLVTASRSWLSRVTPETIALCRIADGALLEGGQPSAEIGFHAGILKARPEVNIVLHFQTPCATALACQAPRAIDYFVIPEIPFYIGPIGRVPYLAPGTEELARAVTDAMREHDLILLANHGQVTVARDVEHAIQNAVFFELACEILVCAGDRVVALPEPEANALLALRQAAQAKV